MTTTSHHITPRIIDVISAMRNHSWSLMKHIRDEETNVTRLEFMRLRDNKRLSYIRRDGWRNCVVVR